MINLNTKLKQTEDLVIDEIDNEFVVFDNTTEDTHILNDIGGFIFKNSNGSSIDDILSNLYQSLDEESQKNFIKEKIFSECCPFIQELVNKNLLHIV